MFMSHYIKLQLTAKTDLRDDSLKKFILGKDAIVTIA